MLKSSNQKISLCKGIIKNLFSMCHFIVNNGWTVDISGKTVDKPGWIVGKPKTFKLDQSGKYM